MIKIIVSEKVKNLSDEINRRCYHEAEYLPIDRFFLNSYLDEILSLDTIEFIHYNLEKVNPTYTIHLFLCLPELWENITSDELIIIIENFSNTFSYYTLIEFTYKYLEINIIPIILKSLTLAEDHKSKIFDYLRLQYNVLIKTEDERDELENGIEKYYFNYNIEKWKSIKHRLLIDKHLLPALNTLPEFKKYIVDILQQ